MRVVVTGGTGYLGSAIVRALAQRGHDPVVFSRRASVSGLPGVAVDGDVRDAAAVRRAALNADAVCHSAALVSVWRKRHADFDDVNVGGLETVLNVCRVLGLSRIVYTSSFLALPPADGAAPLAANDYQRTKLRAHEIARAAASSGLPVVTMVPGVIYGPGADTEGNLIRRLIRDHLSGRLPGLIGSEHPWSFAYIDDVADAHVTALTAETVSGQYLLGGDNARPMRVFEIVREVTGTPLPRRIPFAVATLVALLEEARARIGGGPPLLTRGTVEIFRHDWSMNSARSVAELRYRMTPLETGVRATLEAL